MKPQAPHVQTLYQGRKQYIRHKHGLQRGAVKLFFSKYCRLRGHHSWFQANVAGLGYLDDPGIDPGRKTFRNHPDRPRVPPSLLHNGFRVSFPRVKRPGRGVDHSPASSFFLSGSTTLYRVLAFSTNSFHFPLSWARVFQFGTFIFCISFLTSSSQRVFGLPIGLLERGFQDPHLALRLKKEESYTSPPPVGLRGLF